MPKRKIEKKITFYEPQFNDVLVCKNPDDNAYLEIFHEKPENVSMEGLGSLLGIFEINDNSEDSSYVPNYLISIIKKEFYSRPKRGSIESFEMALHKANLALSQLASQGNINWIGKLNAVCAVIEKNNFHFAQTGEISVLLIRSKTLTNLSEEEEIIVADPNPLKTFRDVLSGRLEKDDKVIMSTNAIFQIFSLDELKNASLKFSREDLIQFLNTALVNQLDRAAVLVTDLEEQEKEALETVRRPMKVNAFSQESYLKKETTGDSGLDKDEDKKKLLEEIKKEYEKTKGEFVDEKTGHIYIREDSVQENQNGRVMGNIKSYARSIAVGNERNLEKIKDIPFEENESQIEPIQNSNPILDSRFEGPISRRGPSLLEKSWGKIRKFSSALKNISAKVYYFLVNFFKYRVIPALLSLYRKTRNKIAGLKKAGSQATREENIYAVPPSSPPIKKLFPDFSKMKLLVSGFDRKKKIYAIAILILIFIIPYFISKTITKMGENKKPKVAEAPPPEIPLKEDKSVVRIGSLDEVYAGSEISGLVNAKGSFFGITQDALVSLSDKNVFSLPEDFKNPDSIFEMDDLNLIFILKNSKLTSFSPSSKKFQENKISIPDNAKIQASGTFLTYAYLLDSQNNQVYRYPRIEGGFGQKTNWVKDQADLSSAKSLAINENIFVSTENGIQKFLKGKKEEYSIENTATPIIPEKIYTKSTSENLYVLDNKNSRIIKLDKNGNIIFQFYNSEIQQAKDFAVDEEANIIYFSSSDKIKSFTMNQ
jgi:hypothetical protein